MTIKLGTHQPSQPSWLPKPVKVLGLLILGSIAYPLPFLYFKLGILAFFSTAFWLIAILETEDLRPMAGLTVFAALVYSSILVGTPWLRNFSLQAWLIAPLFYVPLFLPIFVLIRLSRAVMPHLPLFLMWPIIFTGAECLRIRLSPGEIPLLQLGTAIARFPALIQIADITGTSGLTFLLCMSAGLCVDMYVRMTRSTSHLKRSTLITGVSCLAVLSVAVLWYGYLEDTTRSFKYGPKVQVVQPNVHGWPGLQRSESRFREIKQVTLQMKGSDVDLIVWPENSFIQSQSDNRGLTDSIATEIKVLTLQLGAPLLVDGPVIQVGGQLRTHRASLIHFDGRIDFYEKSVLVPWSEYIPFQETLHRVNQRWADGFARFVISRNPNLTNTIPGSAPTSSFALQDKQGRTSNFRAPICYEVLNSRLLNQWYRTLPSNEHSAFFLVNPVNEVLLGPTIHEQTLSISMLRAVEGRVSIIRAANNGISGAIDPNGHVYASLTGSGHNFLTDGTGTVYASAIFDKRFITVYARWGDWLPVSCLVLYFCLLASAGLKRRLQR